MDNNIASYINEIERNIHTDFELKLFRNAIQKLKYTDDPTRYNSFASTYRELLRHIFNAFAPDDDVRKCNWFFNP